MKRELKREMPEIRRLHEEAIAEPIPMKRELKLDRKALDGEVRVSDCRAYPDEKGIETGIWRVVWREESCIAEPIPMKRELKRHI